MTLFWEAWIKTHFYDYHLMTLSHLCHYLWSHIYFSLTAIYNKASVTCKQITFLHTNSVRDFNSFLKSYNDNFSITIKCIPFMRPQVIGSDSLDFWNTIPPSVNRGETKRFFFRRERSRVSCILIICVSYNNFCICQVLQLECFEVWTLTVIGK